MSVAPSASSAKRERLAQNPLCVVVASGDPAGVAERHQRRDAQLVVRRRRVAARSLALTARSKARSASAYSASSSWIWPSTISASTRTIAAAGSRSAISHAFARELPARRCAHRAPDAAGPPRSPRERPRAAALMPALPRRAPARRRRPGGWRQTAASAPGEARPSAANRQTTASATSSAWARPAPSARPASAGPSMKPVVHASADAPL